MINVVRVELTPGVEVDFKRLERNFYMTSSCGVCGKASIDAVAVQGQYDVGAADFRMPGAALGRIPAALKTKQAVFEQTGGLHASGLFDAAGEVGALREDVGRHNALDKLIGQALMRGEVPLKDRGVIVSGRASFELMQKAKMAGVPPSRWSARAVVARRRAPRASSHHARRVLEVRSLQRLQPARPNSLGNRMAQLSQDCFASGGELLSVDDAVAAITTRFSPVEGVETVALADADGRVLAEDLVATLQLPPFTNSAVDGYAVRGEDVPSGAARLFRVSGRSQAGSAPARPPVAPGDAVRIFTGAPMPEGADTVFMQEDARLDDAGRVLLPAGLKRGANVRPAGEDIAAGRVVLPANRWLRPQDVAAAAAMGLTQIRVRRRVKVAVFSNGDEIVEPGAARQEAQVFDSNRFMLIAMLRRIGCVVSDLGIRRDDSAQIAGVLKTAARSNDLILSSGGVSTGEGDFVKAAVEQVGTLVFWRIAMKPGRPVAMGVIDGTPPISRRATPSRAS